MTTAFSASGGIFIHSLEQGGLYDDMLNRNFKSGRKQISISTISTISIELIYAICVGIIIMIICSCFWKFANYIFNFDHTAYGINLIQYLVIKVSRFCEYKWMHVDGWYDILRSCYCIFVYYVIPIMITAKLCSFYQSLLNDCKSDICKTVGMLIITLILLSFCIFMFFDLLSVSRIVQESDIDFGYVLGTMTN